MRTKLAFCPRAAAAAAHPNHAPNLSVATPGITVSLCPHRWRRQRMHSASSPSRRRRYRRPHARRRRLPPSSPHAPHLYSLGSSSCSSSACPYSPRRHSRPTSTMLMHCRHHRALPLRQRTALSRQQLPALATVIRRLQRMAVMMTTMASMRDWTWIAWSLRPGSSRQAAHSRWPGAAASPSARRRLRRPYRRSRRCQERQSAGRAAAMGWHTRPAPTARCARHAASPAERGRGMHRPLLA